MNNEMIFKDLPEEFQYLWKLSKKKKLDGKLRDALMTHIGSKRDQFRSSLKQDKLLNKLANYGNNGRWSREKIRELERLIYDHKSPDNDSIHLGKWVSVEIETIFINNQAVRDFISFARKKGYARAITLKNDGSIHPDEDGCDCPREYDDDGDAVRSCDCDLVGKEIVVTFKYGEWTLLTDVCKKLNELKCTVNKTCGLHVHFDMRHLTARQVTTVGKRVARTVPALKQLLPKSRQQNRFCAVDINKHSDRNNGEARYAFVNLLAYGRHKTIEIRGHSGTTDALKIINWIRILRPIMDTRGSEKIETVSSLIQSFRFDVDLIQYITARYNKFSVPLQQPEVKDDVTQDNRQQEVNIIIDSLRYANPDAVINSVVPQPEAEYDPLAITSQRA